MCTIMAYCGRDGKIEEVTKGLEETISRGPDDQRVIKTQHGVLGFQRLSIMGLTPEGMQPFERRLCGRRLDHRCRYGIHGNVL